MLYLDIMLALVWMIQVETLKEINLPANI